MPSYGTACSQSENGVSNKSKKALALTRNRVTTTISSRRSARGARRHGEYATLNHRQLYPPSSHTPRVQTVHTHPHHQSKPQPAPKPDPTPFGPRCLSSQYATPLGRLAPIPPPCHQAHYSLVHHTHHSPRRVLDPGIRHGAGVVILQATPRTIAVARLLTTAASLAVTDVRQQTRQSHDPDRDRDSSVAADASPGRPIIQAQAHHAFFHQDEFGVHGGFDRQTCHPQSAGRDES